MIKDGRLTDVSIGAYARELVEGDDGSKVARGLEIVELSFVAVPADSKANFAAAMDNSFKLKESLYLIEMVKCPECEKEMENKEELKKHMKSKHNKEMESYLSIERRFGEMTEENKINELNEQNQRVFEERNKFLEELNKLKEEKKQLKISEYKRLCAEKQIKDKDLSKVSEETIEFLIEQIRDIKISNVEKKELKSEVVHDEVKKNLNNLVIENSPSGKYSIWAMPDIKGQITINKW